MTAAPAAAQTTGTVKGKVVDGKGQPVDKVVVTIEFKGGTNAKREVKTNKRGEFIQVGLQPGGQPGAAGPDADQHGIGLEQAAGARQQVGVERLGVEMESRHGSPRRYWSRMIAAACASASCAPCDRASVVV